MCLHMFAQKRRGVAITGCVRDTDIPQEVRVGTLVLHMPALAYVPACSEFNKVVYI